MNYLDRCSEPGLRFADYAKSLVNTAKLISESRTVKESGSNDDVLTDDGALTIGIFGNWGTGKTTLMQCIEKEFKRTKALKKSRYKTIWFSPWKYDTKEKIWNALIQTILAEIEKDENLDADARQKCKELAGLMRFYAYEVGRELILGAIKHQVKQTLNVDLAKLKEIHQSDSISEMYRNLNRFELDFKSLVESYVGKQGSLIVFIDDLDRCLPTEALTVLEALKLYLDRANCVFFIGLDRRTIEQAVREKYPVLEITGKDYIEKMIQLNFFIPETIQSEIVDLLQGSMNPIAHHIGKRLWSLISIATDRNLRRMKQYLLAWNLVKDLLPENITDNEHQQMAVFLLFQMYFPKFYEILSMKSYTSMSNYLLLLESSDNTRSNRLGQNPELKEFWENDSLKKLIEEACSRKDGIDPLLLTDPDNIKNIMMRLSATGVSTNR